jgi:hypothetical protein
MAEQAHSGSSGLRDGIREIRNDLSRERMETRIEDAIEEKPIVKYLIDLRILFRAVLIGLGLALFSWLLIGPRFAAFLLLVSFFASWAILAAREYNRRRPTQPVDDED